jgi:3-hydroxybutyryl-CoA dehydrogenase
MHISIVGKEEQRKELEAKFGSGHSYHFSTKTGVEFYAGSEVAFDFTLADRPSAIDFYNEVHLPVFADMSFTSLNQIAENSLAPMQTNLMGFCGLRTLINRPVLEVSVYQQQDRNMVKRICEKLETSFLIVQDQPGLITARVIAMIINEAYFTLEEGTASKEDIDLAMKLGTNYPYGPFEWCDRIGKRNVVRLLQAVYAHSADDRYRLCKMLEE